MWDLGNREIIVLVSVISGWAILFNIFGPYLAFTITLLIIVCGWFTYIVSDDTPFTPHALLALDYIEQAASETNIFLTSAYRQIFVNIASIARTFFYYLRKNIFAKMSQRHRRSNYQLSSDTRSSAKNSSSTRFSLVEGLSPIPRGNFRQIGNLTNVENSLYVDSETRILERASSMGQLTSTPLLSSWRKENARNGDIFASDNSTSARITWKNSHSFTQNHTSSRGEDIAYGAEASPWGTSISPKMRSRAAGVKTVQTVAGPLLASTRYNIDPKVYSDITSPGLTTRLTRYATEANTKLTHQSQYGTGQFPRVNLNSSPTPLINAKTGKMRMPVTVRVAPPENTRYSPPERQQILSDICHVESKAPMPSVVQVLREISLKRHASREDVTFELAKKQRTEGVFSDGLENLEEMTQKRARDDSSRSEEDISPPNKALRPAKRSKMPSCHDILSSLSSSISVSSGVKRKAIDVSRSGTPDVGKHFKSLDSSHGDGTTSPALSRSVSEPMKSNKRLLNESENRSSELQRPNKKSLESSPQKGIVKSSSPRKDDLNNACGDSRQRDRQIFQRDVGKTREKVTSEPSLSSLSSSSSSCPVKLTDKLFMKAEPKNIDKIKTLIEEHGSTKPRFTTEDTDEIKKSDIVMMRQTSMKTRLKSMFDAISGKAPSKINPEVVIQAEEKSSSSQLSVASLNSTTSTTHVNTAPIATSAIVPIIGKTKPATTPAKHVTFQFTSNATQSKTDSVESGEILSSSDKKISAIVEPRDIKKSDSTAVVEQISLADLICPRSNTTTSSTPIPIASSIFTSPSIPAISQNSSAISAQVTKASISTTTSSSSSSPVSVVTTSTLSPQFKPQIYNSLSTSSLFGIPTSTMTKSISSPLTNFPTQATEKNSQSSTSFSFGVSKMATPTTSGQSVSLKTTQTPETSVSQTVSSAGSGLPAVTAISSGLFGFGSAAKPTYSDSSTIGTFNTPSSGSPIFGGNNQTTEKKAFTFGATTAAAAPATSTIFQAPGITTTSQQTSNSLAQTTTSTASGFNFSTGNAPAITMFGTSSANTTTAPSSGFSTSTSTTPVSTFGTNPTSAMAAKSGFSFVTTPATSSTAPTSSSNVPTLSFGVASNNSAASSLFGGSSTSSPSMTAQQSIFGATPTTTSSMKTQPSIFGTPATTSSGTIVMQPSIFGTTAACSSGFAGSTIPSGFGTTVAQSSSFPTTSSAASTTFGTQKTMETPAFGSANVVPSSFAPTATSSSLFSGVNTDSSATTPNPLSSSFGNSGFGQKSTPSFGASAAAAATSNFPTTTGNASSLFYSQPTESFGGESSGSRGPPPVYGFSNASPAPTFGTSGTAPSIFGATNNTATTSFGTTTTATPVFGSISTTTPAFGTSNTSAGTLGNSNATSTNFSSPGATFGSTTTAPPPFPASIAASSSVFGGSSTNSGFGGTGNQPPPPAFNTAAPSFTNFAGTSGSTLPFGAQASTGSATFGTASQSGNTGFGGSANNNSANTNFTFGGNQQNVQQPQQNSVFAFGGGSTNSVNTAASGSSPFQFGTAAPPQTGGFNFTGAPTAPAINFSKDGASGGSFSLPTAGANSFNAPPTSGGMFSIGTGSTAPRSRPSRRRQR